MQQIPHGIRSYLGYKFYLFLFCLSFCLWVNVHDFIQWWTETEVSQVYNFKTIVLKP